jgi:hypothetical protein
MACEIQGRGRFTYQKKKRAKKKKQYRSEQAWRGGKLNFLNSQSDVFFFKNNATFTFKCNCGNVEIDFFSTPCLHTYDCCSDCTGTIRDLMKKGGPNHLAHQVEGDEENTG